LESEVEYEEKMEDPGWRQLRRRVDAEKGALPPAQLFYQRE
jgi:hypothetical protein